MVGEPAAAGARDGDPGLVLLLGLCPLLAVTDSLATGLGLALGTLAVVCAGNLLAAASRGQIDAGIRLPVVLLVIAATLTAVELLGKAFLFDFYLAAGALLPLTIANGVILGRSTSVARAPPLRSALGDGLRQGIGFALLLILVGALRQFIGAGLALALPPAGAFLALALLAAARNAVAAR